MPVFKFRINPSNNRRDKQVPTQLRQATHHRSRLNHLTVAKARKRLEPLLVEHCKPLAQ
jgi:hypothetical protein